MFDVEDWPITEVGMLLSVMFGLMAFAYVCDMLAKGVL